MSKIEDTQVKDYCEWFFFTGMRPKEIRSLTWGDFNRETWTVKLRGRTPRLASPGHWRSKDRCSRIVEHRLQARRLDCPFIFHRNGSQMGEFRKTWKSACKAAVAKTAAYVESLPRETNIVPIGSQAGIACQMKHGHLTDSARTISYSSVLKPNRWVPDPKRSCEIVRVLTFRRQSRIGATAPPGHTGDRGELSSVAAKSARTG